MKEGLITLIVLLGIHGMYAQSSSMATEEKRRNARKTLSETPHRVKMTVEMRETADSKWELYSSQTKEVAGRDRWHLTQHTGLKLELIAIGDRTYQKMPDGSWQLRSNEGGYTGPTVRSVSKPVVESNVVAEKTDGGKVVETRSESKLQVIRTGEVVNMDHTTREGFDQEGRLISVETEHFNFERKKFQRVTELYEYDPNIRIEAPIPS